MSTRTPLMAGNWKMNLDHLQGTHLVQKLDWTLQDAKHDYGAVEVVVLPPFTDLRSVQTLVEGDRLRLQYGAQDLSPHDSGAYTGDVSGAFLAKLGCRYVVVGHSERREGHGESDGVVASKAAAALRPDARFQQVERAGHAPFLTHPQTVADAVLGFLDAPRGSESPDADPRGNDEPEP